MTKETKNNNTKWILKYFWIFFSILLKTKSTEIFFECNVYVFFNFNILESTKNILPIYYKRIGMANKLPKEFLKSLTFS